MEDITKEYCIIGFEGLDTLKNEIISVAIDNANFVINQNVLICRFRTPLKTIELDEVFNGDGKRSYFIFELNPLTSAVNINHPEYQELLFSNFDKKKRLLGKNKFISPSSEANMPNTGMGFVMGDEIMKHFTALITENVGNNNNNKSDVKEIHPSKEELKGYNKNQKDELINKLLLKGAINLTSEDKKILDYLTNN